VPIITYPGDTFASRVTASMLKAIGLDELTGEQRQRSGPPGARDLGEHVHRRQH